MQMQTLFGLDLKMNEFELLEINLKIQMT